MDVKTVVAANCILEHLRDLPYEEAQKALSVARIFRFLKVPENAPKEIALELVEKAVDFEGEQEVRVFPANEVVDAFLNTYIYGELPELLAEKDFGKLAVHVCLDYRRRQEAAAVAAVLKNK